MKKLITILVLAVICFYHINPVLAANTHSIDLEKDSSQYLSNLTPTSALAIDGDITIQGWVKFESKTAIDGVQQVLLMHGDKDSGNNEYTYNFFFRRDATDGNTLAFFHRNSALDSERVQVAWDPTLAIWYHIATTISGSTVKFYVDGAQQGLNKTLSLTRSADADADLFIGALYGTGSYTDGLLDDIRIYNIARTEAQIASDYQKELVGNEANLVGYWKLNNDLLDKTSNNNDLTNNNSAVFSSDVPFIGEATFIPQILIY